MENPDRLNLDSKVTVNIFNEEGTNLSSYTSTGFHSLEKAVEAAVANSNMSVNPEDCVFEVTNHATGVTHRYRLNAHAHLKLLE